MSLRFFSWARCLPFLLFQFFASFLFISLAVVVSLFLPTITDTSVRGKDGCITDAQEALLYAKAIRDAVDRQRKESSGEHQIKKVLVFTNRTVVSKLFQQDAQRVLPDFRRFHMDSQLRSQERQQVLNLFDECECAIISNPALLKQGVDLPLLDMVVFGPGSSEVDITQKIGRSTRTSFRTGKPKGYVLLPFLVKNGSEPSYELLSRYKEQNYEFVQKIVKKLGGLQNTDVQFSIVEDPKPDTDPWVKKRIFCFCNP